MSSKVLYCGALTRESVHYGHNMEKVRVAGEDKIKIEEKCCFSMSKHRKLVLRHDDNVDSIFM